ncbi:MAG: COX15/CtaA family protein [Pseudonocardia sp.]|nr:COX15/CtaA family protein [Pseudonocardia sp.]
MAALVTNIGIVITGVAVRLTGSGLGCPTWPRCTDDSYVNTPEYGIHGLLEFGNRLLAFAVGLACLAALVAALVQRRRRRGVVLLAAAVFIGIPAQAVLGGITVLTGLNPWTVAGHFLLSIALIYLAYALWVRSREGDGPREWRAGAPVRWLVRGVVAVTAVVLVLGTVVTGSGPHAGDAAAARTGLDPEAMSQLHADSVFLLVGLTIGAWAALAANGAPAAVTRAAAVLLGIELSQGILGFVQYVTDLPVLLVGLHVAGACATWVAALVLLFRLRTRKPTAPSAVPPSADHDDVAVMSRVSTATTS